MRQTLALSALALAPACNAFGFPGMPAPPPGAPPSLYDVSYPVTFVGTTGRTGPSLGFLQSQYGAWSTNSAYFAQGSWQGYQLYTVPQTGQYKITAKGAQGGASASAPSYGAAGAKVSATFDLTMGQKIEIIVGQGGGGQNSDPGNEGGGGGGSFVLKFPRSAVAESDILLIAGGGGGAWGYGNSCDYETDRSRGEGLAKGPAESIWCTNTRTTSSASAGYGGNSAGANQGAAGGGFRSSGANGGGHCVVPLGGNSVQSGLVGGTSNTCYGSSELGAGGFGGGGGGCLGSPGGAGGYTGGSAYGSWSAYSTYGGGGGSYSTGADTEMVKGGGDTTTQKGTFAANGGVMIELLSAAV